MRRRAYGEVGVGQHVVPATGVLVDEVGEVLAGHTCRIEAALRARLSMTQVQSCVGSMLTTPIVPARSRRSVGDKVWPLPGSVTLREPTSCRP